MPEIQNSLFIGLNTCLIKLKKSLKIKLSFILICSKLKPLVELFVIYIQLPYLDSIHQDLILIYSNNTSSINAKSGRSWHVDNNSLIGTATSLKQFILVSKDVLLRFIDAQSFIAGGTLKQFGKDFGGIDNSAKGIFPYEAINTENFNEVLSKYDPFEYNDFYSSLTQKHLINETEYEQYVEDAKRFNSRWDYLLAYNDNDVEMMIQPIDNLINLNAKYNVDLISNLSLSKNAVCEKYALAYKDFNPNIDYAIINTKNEFIPTHEWWSYKCDSYYYQDQKFNKLNPKSPQRDLSKCVDDEYVQ